jgi:hypothetical protein
MAPPRKLHVFERLLVRDAGRAAPVLPAESIDNVRGDRFRVGTIVRHLGAVSPGHGPRGIVQRVAPIATVRAGAAVHVAWAAPAVHGTSTRGMCIDEIEHIDVLVPIGQAHDAPPCVSESGDAFTGYGPHWGHWFQGGLPRSRRGATSPVTKWAVEMAILVERLKYERHPKAREVLEARAVKLDHLMSVYGTLGRRE